MSYEIKLMELPDQLALTMRTTLAVEKLPEFFGKAFGGIMAYLEEMKEYPSGMPFGAYYNLDMRALDVEAGFPVSKTLASKGEIKATVIPGGKYISTIHKGAYDTVQPAYDALAAWAKQHGYETTGVAYEYYLNDPNEDPSIVAETEIRFALK
jgi:effector-binding domain-containing protein